MANLLSPDLFDRLLWFAMGGGFSALIIAVSMVPNRSYPKDDGQLKWHDLTWHESAEGAAEARKMARQAMRHWWDEHGPMSALQAVSYAVEILSGEMISGWTNDLDLVRINVINLARRVVSSHQRPANGRNGAGGVQ